MKRLSFRFCRRVFLILAILFPIVYLCGGLFFALAGSHGNYDWHENTLVNRDYEEAMKTENFKYSDWEWKNEHGTRLGFSLGYAQCFDFVGMFSSSTTGVKIIDDSGIVYNYGLGYYNPLADDVGHLSIYINISEGISIDEGWYDVDSYFCGYVIENSWEDYEVLQAFVCTLINDVYSLSLYTYEVSSSSWVLESNPSSFDDSDNFFVYFDDGANLPQGVEWNDELRSYFVPTLKPIESNSLSDYIFSQPFVNDNFITSLGRGVLDDTAFGFSPFRDMFNWFNDSVMHIESDDALGVFGLGYAYYALNVVAVYELVVLVMMVFLLPLRITDKFMGDNL